MVYQATRASVTGHPMPAWFEDAKLGIFVHWGPYSVPGWAPRAGDLDTITRQQGWEHWFTNNPYAEWYANSLRIAGSPTQRYHAQTYGAGTPYDLFAGQFRQAAVRWEPDMWAELFQQSGARYVVQVTKHHDGFLMWPSRRPNARKADWFSARDLVWELTAAVRARGLKMGLYYSAGLDWTFDDRPIRDLADMLLAIPQGAEYAEYVNEHWQELIERYQPSVMWNDIGYPAAANLWRLFASYYNRVPDGVVNDRFAQLDLGRLRRGRGLLARGMRAALRRILPLVLRLSSGGGSPSMGVHADFRTPEYTSYSKIVRRKWEATRGLGHSFGYNRNESESEMLSLEELVRSFVDIVSKNGNLLLNVGPMADGTIPEPQRQRLLGLGRWLEVHGEAIYGTRPWRTADGGTDQGLDVRFTFKEGILYAILLGTPRGSAVTLRGLQAVRPSTTVSWLPAPAPISWRQAGADLVVEVPAGLSEAPAHAVRIAPAPVLEA